MPPYLGLIEVVNATLAKNSDVPNGNYKVMVFISN